MVDVVPPSAPMSTRITTPGITSKVKPMTSSIATPRRITTRVARPSVNALVRRSRLVDPIAHHLKNGEDGALGASHRPRVIILAATWIGVITLPGEKRLSAGGAKSSQRLRSWQRTVASSLA